MSRYAVGRLTNCNPQEPPQNHVNVCGFWRPAESSHVALAFPHGKKSCVSHPRLITTAQNGRLLAPVGCCGDASLPSQRRQCQRLGRQAESDTDMTKRSGREYVCGRCTQWRWRTHALAPCKHRDKGETRGELAGDVQRFGQTKKRRGVQAGRYSSRPHPSTPVQ